MQKLNKATSAGAHSKDLRRLGPGWYVFVDASSSCYSTSSPIINTRSLSSVASHRRTPAAAFVQDNSKLKLAPAFSILGGAISFCPDKSIVHCIGNFLSMTSPGKIVTTLTTQNHIMRMPRPGRYVSVTASPSFTGASNIYCSTQNYSSKTSYGKTATNVNNHNNGLRRLGRGRHFFVGSHSWCANPSTLATEYWNDKDAECTCKF